MKIGISTIAYNQPESLLRLIQSAKSKIGQVQLYITLHNKVKDVTDILYTAEMQYDAKIYPYGFNRGVSRTWNDSLIIMRDDGCDVWILMNDDVWFTDGDVDKIAQAAVGHREAYAIFCSGYHVGFDTPINCHGMSCFAMQPVALESIGFYDQNFFPAYNEDVDYSRRAGRAGLKPYIVSDTNVHHIGSAAIKTSPQLSNQNYITHGMNNEYWKSKWGCQVTEIPKVGFWYPFNNNEFHPYFIGEKERYAPYPGYNRKDWHIVGV